MFCDLWDDEPTLKWELLLGLERQLSLKPRTEASQSKVYTPGLVTFLKDLSSGPRDGVGEGLSEMGSWLLQAPPTPACSWGDQAAVCMEYRDPEPQDSSCRTQSGGGWECPSPGAAVGFCARLSL